MNIPGTVSIFRTRYRFSGSLIDGMIAFDRGLAQGLDAVIAGFGFAYIVRLRRGRLKVRRSPLQHSREQDKGAGIPAGLDQIAGRHDRQSANRAQFGDRYGLVLGVGVDAVPIAVPPRLTRPSSPRRATSSRSVVANAWNSCPKVTGTALVGSGLLLFLSDPATSAARTKFELDLLHTWPKCVLLCELRNGERSVARCKEGRLCAPPARAETGVIMCGSRDP